MGRLAECMPHSRLPSVPRQPPAGEWQPCARVLASEEALEPANFLAAPGRASALAPEVPQNGRGVRAAPFAPEKATRVPNAVAKPPY